MNASLTSGVGDPPPLESRLGVASSQIDSTEPQVDLKPQQTARPLQPPPPQSCLDPKGDLCIDVGTHPKRSFRVCSRTLARVSPFWDKMLYGEFIESKKPSCQDEESLEWTVKLPADNPTAMGLLLSIIHGQFDVVPSYENPPLIRDLYDICVITDKYDMAHVLQPWAKGWLRSTLTCSTELESKSLREQYCHERLWISWALGDRADFERIAKIMLLTSCTSIHDPNNLRRSRVLEPPEIYDIIEKTRLDIIKALLRPFHTVIGSLIIGDKMSCKGHENYPEICIPLMLGAGIQSLHSVGLWPIPKPAEITWSVSILSDKLRSVKIESKAYPEIGLHKCFYGEAIQAEMKRVLDSIPPLLTEGHKRHLECQARKSGLQISR